MTLEIGDSAPEFTLPTDSQGEVSLADFKDRKNVVIYFYPKDDTPGCTTESKDFRDHLEAFDAANTVIIGISKDSVTSHDKFKAKHALNVALASDENGDVCERYGVWVEKNMYGKKYMGIQRATFLINTSGNLACIWPKVKVSGHVQEVLKTVQALS
jgi:peroxiredoxin Q/BCP